MADTVLPVVTEGTTQLPVLIWLARLQAVPVPVNRKSMTQIS